MALYEREPLADDLLTNGLIIYDAATRIVRSATPQTARLFGMSSLIGRIVDEIIPSEYLPQSLEDASSV